MEWMSHEATRLVKRHEVLDLHNDMLQYDIHILIFVSIYLSIFVLSIYYRPDLKKLKTDHEDKVRKLNEKMSERARYNEIILYII